ncbi:MAG: hypothetical protein U5K71_12280 [Gracilimonas sp.]|nr:hypothetical protein [Gracilimonas sp.]
MMSKIDSDTSKKTLYLDIGNSTIKGAYKAGTQWTVLTDERLVSALEMVNWIHQHPDFFDKIVIASVRDDVSEAIARELDQREILEVSVSDIRRRPACFNANSKNSWDRWIFVAILEQHDANRMNLLS